MERVSFKGLHEIEESKGLSSQYKIKKVLGGGGNSSTFIAESLLNPGKDYVLKMISLDEVENSELLKDEVKLHQLLSEHESIISIIEHFIEENILYVITEYAEKGDLKLELATRKKKSENLRKNAMESIQVDKRKSKEILKVNSEGDNLNLKKKQLFSTEEILELMIQISKGVVYIHSQSIVHKDLKPANIFLKIDGTPQIGDFGISRVLKDVQYIFSVNCTIDYAPPELLHYGKFDFKGDVWAMGIILYELCTGNKPFGFLSGQPKIDFIIEHHPDFTKLTNRDTTIRMLIKSMLKKNPQRRPNMKSVLNSLIIIQNKEVDIEKSLRPIISDQTMQAHPHTKFEYEMKVPLVDVNPPSNQTVDLMEELNKETVIEKLRLSIYKSSNFTKWIYTLLLVTSLSQILLWIDDVYLLKGNLSGHEKIWPSFQTLYMMNSMLGYTKEKFIWIDLITYVVEVIVAMYGLILAFKLTKYNLKLTIFLFYILLLLYIIKIICICSIAKSERGIFLHIPANAYIFEISIPALIFNAIILLLGHMQQNNYSKLRKLEPGKEVLEIKHQFTNNPLYESSNYVYGVGVALTLLGGKYFFYSMCQSFHWGNLPQGRPLVLLASIGRSLVYIAGGIYCFLKAKSQEDTLKTSRYCYYVMLLTQVSYMIISTLMKFRGVSLDKADYWMLPQDFFIAIFTTGVSYAYYYTNKQRNSLDRSLFYFLF